MIKNVILFFILISFTSCTNLFRSGHYSGVLIDIKPTVENPIPHKLDIIIKRDEAVVIMNDNNDSVSELNIKYYTRKSKDPIRYSVNSFEGDSMYKEFVLTPHKMELVMLALNSGDSICYSLTYLSGTNGRIIRQARPQK